MTGPSASTPTQADALFAARALACRRGLRRVFAGLDFALAPGGALILTGPNGSGKSSLLRVLAGLIPAEAGALTWQGAPVAADPEAHRARLAYLGHGDAVKLALTAGENLDFWIAVGGGEVSARDPALDAFGLRALADLPARYLSAGQRRRLALARIAAVPRALWLLDEPSIGLDDVAIESLRAAIARHRAANGVVVLATHAPLGIRDAASLDLARYAAARAEAA